MKIQPEAPHGWTIHAFLTKPQSVMSAQLALQVARGGREKQS